MANIIYSMIQPFKVQWEAKNSENAGIYALRVRLCALRARHPEKNHASTGALARQTFGPNFVAL